MSDAWTLENVLKVRDTIRASDLTAPVRDERFHEAAALVSSFDIADGTFTGVAAANLIADSIPAKEGSNRWTLKNSIRRRVLKQLRTREALQNALRKTADRPNDPLQRAIEDCVSGSMKSLREQTFEELAASMQVVDWLNETELKESLPAIDDVRRKVEYAALLDPLRALTGSNFFGRRTELAALANYVEGGNGERKPMLVFGPGGMGKSALIAKFVLDRIGRLPIVYLDCDRPGLAPQEPLTFLAEAVRQLGLQFETFRSPAEKLRSEWLRTIALTQTDNANTRGRTAALDEFRVFVTDIGVAQSPVLFVIDTFEEVQYRSRSIAREVAEFLNELRQRLPRLRTVIAGRNPTSDFEVMALELGELDEEASQGLLGRLGVESSNLQNRLARLLHGNPLSLRLAAAILKADDTKGWTDLEGLTDDTAIQGVLYGRILGHIHQEDVKRIAHPGLILRRITADLIRNVLAEPCGVEMDDPKYSDTLFTLLRAELSLVIPEGDAVRHRSDVRRVMLEPLRNDRKEVVRHIEEQAVNYYTPYDDVTSRAEEIYHRLSLGQSRDEVDARWLPGIEDSLRSAVEELPKPARTYLATRLGLELYEDWDRVDQKTWEDYAARQSEDLLKLDRPLEAVRLMRRRAVRLPASPLYWFHAQALRRAGQVLESREVARQAVEQMVAGTPITQELLDWFAGPELRAVPSTFDVRRQIAQFEILGPLRALAGSVFVGRQQELRAIAGYVFSRETSARPLLMICGPGGIGKSALIAKFVLDSREQLDPVYINLDVLTPDSRSHVDRIWAEIYRQLSLMWPVSPNEPAAERPVDVQQLRSFLGLRRGSNRPLLVVIDTVEELQAGAAAQLYANLNDLQAFASFLRVVLVSRTPPASPGFEVIEISGLPTEAAEALLSALAIQSSEARHKVLAVAGSSPLTLKLAAELVQQSGAEALDGLSPAPELAPYLLDRLLTRIPDIEVRALSRGGLAVRRITAEVIERVLAGPLQLSVDDAHAQALLESLALEASMFAQIDPGVVRPRLDFRQLLRKSIGKTPFTRAIDEAAVAYYQARNEPEFRAEEIFHRIMLGQTSEEIDGRWIDGVEEFLQDVASEVSGQIHDYLAVRLGFADVDVDSATADQATWEVYVVKRAGALVGLGKLPDALDLVQKRSTRMRRSPLYAIEAQILLSMARAREAVVVGRRGLELWPDDKALAAVVAAAEQALGPDETFRPQSASAPLPSQGAFYLRHDVSADEVLGVLGGALPTLTDSMNAFRSIQGLPSGVLSHLESIVKWAARTHRLDELVTAAAAYAPADPTLAAFLVTRAKRVESSGADPISRVLLERGHVFFNRQILRDFLGGLVSGEARSRVLVVNGPSGSGKSFTSALVDSVAHATSRLAYRRFELSGAQSASDFVREIFDAFQWRLELSEPSSIEHMARYYAQDVPHIIRRKGQESRATIVLHIDTHGESRAAAIDLLRGLIADPDRLALILSGFSKDLLPENALIPVTLEEVTRLSSQDIEDGLLRVYRELNRSVTDAEVAAIASAITSQVEQLIVPTAGERDDFNARFQQSVKAFIARL
jgi:hypothetical protein